jgi:hypothetical protein
MKIKKQKIRKFLKSEDLINLIVLLAIFGFLLSFFKPELLLSATVTTGGDTASHYYPAYYLKNYLLPNGKIIGWCPGWYIGMPMFQFYFPLTFILMDLLSFLIPLQIAFKLITALGSFLLPITTFFGLRLMKFKFPVPILASIFVLAILFNQGNSMWGINIPSTLAGEFSESFGASLMILFFGFLYKGIGERKFLLRNALMFAVIAFSHIITALIAITSSVFFLLQKKKLFSNFKYLFLVFTIGFLLVAFWFLPFIAKVKYTSHFAVKWYYGDAWKEIFPDIFLPFYVFTAFGLYYAWKKKDQRILFFIFPIIMGTLLYFIGPMLGIIEIRFVPFVQLFPLFIGAYGLGELLKKFSSSKLLPLIVLVIALIWINHNVTYIGYWIEWNYSGFEAKQLWPSYKAVNDFLKGDQNDPRVVYEHSPFHNSAGTERAFESLPLFSGRSTLEGLYLQSIETSPFVFYIQSEISQVTSCPFPEWSCTTFNSTKAAKHLEMFNVKDVVARTDTVKAELNTSSLYKLVATFDPYEIYELKTNDGHYVTVPKYEPVLFETKEWKKVAYYKWFSNESLLDVPLVFTENANVDSKDFKLIRTDGSVDDLPKVPIDNNNCNIQERVNNEEIVFKTNCVGKPHIIRISYFPNWKVDGASRIYMVSPSFMLLFPEKQEVRVWYGSIFVDYLGDLLTIAGLAIVIYLSLLKSHKVIKFRKR